MPADGQTQQTEGGASSGLALGAGFGVGAFPTGEARSVNIGTAKKPCWVVEGPKPSAADIQWAREVALAAIPRRTAEEGATASQTCAQSAGTQNRWTSPEESDGREASGECVPAENFSPNNSDEGRAKRVPSGAGLGS